MKRLEIRSPTGIVFLFSDGEYRRKYFKKEYPYPSDNAYDIIWKIHIDIFYRHIQDAIYLRLLNR